jgi:DNA polymerase III alpha subunit
MLMHRDIYGHVVLEEEDLMQRLYRDPDFDFSGVTSTVAREYNHSVEKLHVKFPKLTTVDVLDLSQDVETFDQENQKIWFMPEQYQNLDVWEHLSTRMALLVQRNRFGPEHLDRVLTEMNMFEQRGMMPLLRYLIYLVDVMRDNQVLWGVGRGSSVASYVLYLIGVHRVDSFKYNLNIGEFLK